MSIKLRNAVQEQIKAWRQETIFAAAKAMRTGWAEGHDTLYKFMSLTGDGFGYVKDVLENSRVYFSAISQLNDPADCRPVFKLAGSLDNPSLIQELEEDQARMFAEEALSPAAISQMQATEGVAPISLAESITAHTRGQLERNTRVYCMTARPDQPLMWAHYAEKHTGVCLHFRCRSKSLFGLARRVNYVEQRRPILIPLKYCVESELPDIMVFDKAQDWRYEEEYRIIAHDHDDNDYKLEDGKYISFEPHQLIGITFGMRTSDPHRDALKAIIARRSTCMLLFQAVENEAFTIDFRRIT